jgi:transposase-like protein
MAHLEEHHFTQLEPILCKWCGSVEIKKYGLSGGTQEYFCLSCKRKFTNNDNPIGKRSTVEDIGTSISAYYDGLSFNDIARHLKESGNEVSESTVYRWVLSYAQKAIRLADTYHPKVGNIIDKKTRLLIASYLSENRGAAQAQRLMEIAYKRAGVNPSVIITDKLRAYLDGIETVFGGYTEHIQSSPFAEEDNTNVIERMQGTIKDRTKVLRGFKTFETALIIMDGFLIHYNYFKPHLSLQGKTPAEMAGIKLPFKTWTEFVRSDK